MVNSDKGVVFLNKDSIKAVKTIHSGYKKINEIKS